MRAVIDCIKGNAMPLEFCIQLIVNIMQVLFFDKSSADARLVGDNDNQESCLLYFFYSLETEGIDVDHTVGVGISDIRVDGSVSIDKYGFFFQSRNPLQVQAR